jgi:hypothetical protein
MQEFLIHVVILVLMTGVLLFWAIPFIAVALWFHRASAPRLGAHARFVAACGIAALGIAPHFDAYRQPYPIWLRWCEGDAVGAGYALASFALTWALVMLQLKAMHHRRPKAA